MECRQQKLLRDMNDAQCRAGRALVDWSQGHLAKEAGVGLSTVVDFERARRAVSADAVGKIRAALIAAGVEFTNGNQPGVRLALPAPTSTPAAP